MMICMLFLLQWWWFIKTSLGRISGSSSHHTLDNSKLELVSSVQSEGMERLWPNNRSPHNGTMLFLILIFATITGLAAHYSHLLQGCMAATSGRSRRLIALEDDGVELWIGEVLQLWFGAVGNAWQRRS